MENGSPDVIEQVPAGGGQNTPSSGTYGEDVALDRLKASLPNTDGANPTQTRAGATPGASPVSPPAPGLPSGIFAPSAQPQTPVSTPLSGGLPPMSSTPEERLIDGLQRLIEDPERTAATKEWAQAFMDRLIRE